MKLLKIGISGVRGIVGRDDDSRAGHGLRLRFRDVPRFPKSPHRQGYARFGTDASGGGLGRALLDGL